MKSDRRAIFYILIILVGILAGSTSFFAAKTVRLSQNSPKTTLSPSVNAGAALTAQPEATTSSLVSRPANPSDKPSHPSDTYTVKAGETLYAIAQAQGTSWTEIAEANGISDVNKIQANQILVIPKAGQVNLTVDMTRASSLQKEADAGKYQFRLNPEETARSDAPTIYGLAITDNFALKSQDFQKGQAQVQATHEGKNYLITLTQPVTKGEKGIWAIESIKPI